MSIVCYYDYTCGYSYAALRWFERLREALPGLNIEWRTFSLKEVNREGDEPSLFDDAGISSVSITALALAHAARGADFDRYHQTVFTAMKGENRVLDQDDLRGMAADAGVDVSAFEAARAEWVAAVAGEHRDAVERWKVFGTPTVIIDQEEAVYVKFAESPQTPERAAAVWEGIRALAFAHPELIELKRPR